MDEEEVIKELNNEPDEFDDKYIKWFSELNNKDIGIAGGKGASLSEMFNNKFPVPPGFIVTAQSFGIFMEQNGLKEKVKNIIEAIDFEETAELQKASKEIRTLIESEEIPEDIKKEILEAYHILSSEKIEEKGVSQDALNILKNAQEPIFVSVRSSATTEDLAEASFAGQQESFLNVKGEHSLIEHIKKCFSSLYTARAIYYRNNKGFKEGDALLAVVVQKMVDSEKSGVVFSRDPLTLNENIVMEAVYGLGEGIVSGKIKPDHYVASRELKVESVKVADKKIAIVRTGAGLNETVKLSNERSKSQVLTNGEVLEITDLAIKLENHYKKPQDIEFAIEARKVYIVQSRPITTKAKASEKGQELSGNIILNGLGASPGIGVGVVKIVHSMEDLHKIKKGDVLVTTMTNPDMVISMQKSVAIVTDEGGMTAHASIVSREMGIPAIVGTGDATEILKEGMKITVDGTNGKVYEGEVAKTQMVEVKKAVNVSKVKLKIIVDLPEFAERAAESGIDAIGLTRIEGIIASSNKHPLFYEKENNLEDYTELLRQGIEKISLPFKIIWIRTSDIRTDEYSTLKGAPEKEINPMLGLHGTRFLLKHPKILRAELDAIKKVAERYSDKKFGVMFPLVISIEEMKELKKYFNEIKTSNIQIGVMIETPASIQIIDDLCKENIDFISFGTNDLTQFTLGVDRGEDGVQYLYNESNPAVLSQIEKVIKSCRKHNVETSICGQAGSKPEMVDFLFKKGIDSISVNADAALNISTLIKKMEDENVEQEGIEKERVERQSTDTLISDKTSSPKDEKQEQTIANNKDTKTEIKEEKNQEKNPRIINCSACGNETKLPFRPRKNKEYFCKNCFKKRKKENQPSLPKLVESEESQKPITIEDIEEKQEELKEELEREKMLDPSNVQVSAELGELKENIGPVEPVDNLDTIQDKAEDILEQINDFNDDVVEENQEIEDKIKTSGEELVDEERETEDEEKFGEKDDNILPLTEGDYNSENNPEDEEPHKDEYSSFGDEYGGY